MTRLTFLMLALLGVSNSASAEEPECPSDAVVDQAHKLLAFHIGDDERIEIATDIERLPPIANPANPNETFQVLELWGFIYRAQYRMRLTYYPMLEGCVLMGQEILEYASLGDTPHGPDPMPPQAGVVLELSLGDRACYMTIEHDGHTSHAMASMELCERDDLIDQFATFTHEAANVIAMQCEGDPECEEHETVLLITGANLSD